MFDSVDVRTIPPGVGGGGVALVMFNHVLCYTPARRLLKNERRDVRVPDENSPGH